MTTDLAPDGISRKYERLLAVVVANLGRVAFSGGVDSTLLLRVLIEVAPSRAVALFADSVLQSQVDRDNVSWLANRLGAKLMVVAISPLAWADFAANSPARCYLCKQSVYRRFLALSPPGTLLLDGTNLDDLNASRPGQRAIEELGVVSPLALAGLRKAEVREMARWLGLPNWNRPSSSCLATRIPAVFPILPELLRYVEEGECLIRAMGFGHVRLRLNHGRTEDVTVELAEEEMLGRDFPARRDSIAAELRMLGVVRVSFVGRPGVFCS
jgi:uncharacterized protein